MSEQLAAEIQIGGKIRRSVAKLLCKVIAETEASLDWGGARFDPDTADELIAIRIDDGAGQRLLKLYDDHARWGEFDSLEAFLQKHRIPYRRYSEGKYDYDAEISAFHPDGGLVELVTDHNRNPIVKASALTPIAEALAKVLADMRAGEVPAAKLRRKLQGLYGKLRKCLPPEMPALESFEIIEG